MSEQAQTVRALLAQMNKMIPEDAKLEAPQPSDKTDAFWSGYAGGLSDFEDRLLSAGVLDAQIISDPEGEQQVKLVTTEMKAKTKHVICQGCPLNGHPLTCPRMLHECPYAEVMFVGAATMLLGSRMETTVEIMWGTYSAEAAELDVKDGGVFLVDLAAKYDRKRVGIAVLCEKDNG